MIAERACSQSPNREPIWLEEDRRERRDQLDFEAIFTRDLARQRGLGAVAIGQANHRVELVEAPRLGAEDRHRRLVLATSTGDGLGGREAPRAV